MALNSRRSAGAVAERWSEMKTRSNLTHACGRSIHPDHRYRKCIHDGNVSRPILSIRMIRFMYVGERKMKGKLTSDINHLIGESGRNNGLDE